MKMSFLLFAVIVLASACTVKTDYPEDARYQCGPGNPEETPCGQGNDGRQRVCNCHNICVNDPGGECRPCKVGGLCDRGLKCIQGSCEKLPHGTMASSLYMLQGLSMDAGGGPAQSASQKIRLALSHPSPTPAMGMANNKNRIKIRFLGIR